MPLKAGGSTSCALAIAFASGAAAMAHQIIWVRRLIDILGAGEGVFSRVAGAFFLGLAAGAWFAARQATLRPWHSIAVAEAAIAVCAFGVVHVGEWALTWQGKPGVAWILPLLLIGPPAFAMGTVIPWMIRAVGPRGGVALYGVNTFGGIAGLWLAVAWALPVLGSTGASLTALSLNLLLALAALLLSRQGLPPASLEPQRSTTRSEGGLLLPLAFTSGFLVLVFEVIVQHQFAQLLVSSHVSSAIVLALVLAALGVGALLAAPLDRLAGGRGLLVALPFAVLACAIQPVLLTTQRNGLDYLSFHRPFLSYIAEALQVGLPSIFLVLLPAALVFPLLLRRALARGVDAGHLLAVNGVGGWLGAEIADRCLGPITGLWSSMAAVGAGYLLCLLLTPGGKRKWALAPTAAATLVWGWHLDGSLPYASLPEGDALLRVAVGREGVVGVVRGGEDDYRLLFNNTYTLGGSRAQSNQERQVLLPMLLHGEARRVATLGIATGSSLAGATLDPALESVEGIELSPLALRFAREYFAPFNRRVFEDPRVHVTLGDARSVIAQRPAVFDVIAGDLFLPWRTGEGRLFTREHFTNVRQALRPGGIYCQWLPMFQLTEPQFAAIARTFREVFPEAWLIRGDFYSTTPIIGLVGGRSVAQLDWQQITAACTRLRRADQTGDPLLRHPQGVAMCIAGPLRDPGPGPVNTLANGWLEWDAGRNVIGGAQPWFTRAPLAEYLRLCTETGAAALPEKWRPAQTAGLRLHAAEVARTAGHPEAKSLSTEAARLFPPEMQTDPGARWRDFPMRYKPRRPEARSRDLGQDEQD